jgi:hypothetical protein
MALSNSKFVVQVTWRSSVPADISSETVEVSATNSGFVKQGLVNRTAPAGAVTARVKVRLESAAASAIGTAYVDGLLMVAASSLPAAWASSRSVSNHGDDDGQAHSNYIDILDAPGDVPAALKLYIDEQQAGTTLYLGVRHAGEYDDAGLWHEGEDFAIWNSEPADAAASDGAAGKRDFSVVAGSTSPASPDAAATKTVSSPPRGQYRMLVRVKSDAFANDVRYALGYSYGSLTVLPSVAADYTTPSNGSYRLDDLGSLAIPAVGVPDGEALPSIVFAFYMCNAGGGGNAQNEGTLLVDYLFLLPINRGSVFASKSSAQDKWLVDGISRRPGVYVLDRSNDTVKTVPTWLGAPVEAHPRGTRVYLLGHVTSGVISNGWNIKVTYEPRFLVVR